MSYLSRSSSHCCAQGILHQFGKPLYSEHTTRMSILQNYVSTNVSNLSSNNWNPALLSTYLITYLAITTLASANLRRHTSRAIAAWRHFQIQSAFSFSSTCLAQCCLQKKKLQTEHLLLVD